MLQAIKASVTIRIKVLLTIRPSSLPLGRNFGPVDAQFHQNGKKICSTQRKFPGASTKFRSEPSSNFLEKKGRNSANFAFISLAQNSKYIAKTNEQKQTNKQTIKMPGLVDLASHGKSFCTQRNKQPLTVQLWGHIFFQYFVRNAWLLQEMTKLSDKKVVIPDYHYHYYHHQQHQHQHQHHHYHRNRYHFHYHYHIVEFKVFAIGL